MTATRRSTWLAAVVLGGAGFGAHGVARHRRHAPPGDIVFRNGWREVASAVSSHLWLANLALLLALAGIVLAARGRDERPVEAIAMRGVVVLATLAVPVLVPGSARALQRRLVRRTPRRPGDRVLRALAIVSIVGLVLSAAALQAQRHTTWVDSVASGWPTWFATFWEQSWPPQLQLPALAEARSWYIPACLLGAVLLVVMLRRSYESPSLLERRLLGIATVGATVYWTPVLPFLLLSPVALAVAAVLAVATVVVAFAVDLIVGPSAPPPP